jgi:hypothetical protein
MIAGLRFLLRNFTLPTRKKINKKKKIEGRRKRKKARKRVKNQSLYGIDKSFNIFMESVYFEKKQQKLMF